MNDLVIRLSDSDDPPAFMDVGYTSDQDSGNSARTVLSLEDAGGATINLYIKQRWKDNQYIKVEDVTAVDVEIFGGVERSELLHAMKLILEAEKVASIIKWGAQDAL
jgi:hypothetical protein